MIYRICHIGYEPSHGKPWFIVVGENPGSIASGYLGKDGKIISGPESVRNPTLAVKTWFKSQRETIGHLKRFVPEAKKVKHYKIHHHMFTKSVYETS